jgi:predicted nucleotidyltransferase
MDQKTVVQIVKEYLAHLKENEFDISKAYIFGSYAKGTFHKDSDVDLAIILNDSMHPSFDMEVKSMVLRRKNETILESHLFSDNDFIPSNPIVNEILKSGIEV